MVQVKYEDNRRNQPRQRTKECVNPNAKNEKVRERLQDDSWVNGSTNERLHGITTSRKKAHRNRKKNGEIKTQQTPFSLIDIGVETSGIAQSRLETLSILALLLLEVLLLMHSETSLTNEWAHRDAR